MSVDDSDSPPQSRIMRVLRGQLGSVRRVYLRSNRIVRRDDFHTHPETVLLLHGFMQTRNVWQIMEHRLRETNTLSETA